MAGFIPWIGEHAALEREAATTDTPVKPVAQGLQLLDAPIKSYTDVTADAPPVSWRGCSLIGQACERRAKLFYGQAERLGAPDEGDSANV